MAGKFCISKGKDGKDYFVLKAGNGEVIFQSQGYKSASGCENGIESVRKHAADESNFECREAKDGRKYFILKASNGQEIGRSQMYKSESGCMNGIASVAKNAGGASISDERDSV
ncbi:YegP family protein [Marinicella gelatinilytica]|uniref:YegP family protein n=1 Tax=Marinicella gelatinilytica TaxID=2996017 RepID=UPI002260CB72|nr:YegP family protein [Marinicella gelatinilytica]MCX7545700.1 YegP family protein [Marinicella gelatinilytica]